MVDHRLDHEPRCAIPGEGCPRLRARGIGSRARCVARGRLGPYRPGPHLTRLPTTIRDTVPESVIVVNADGPDTRVALIENGILSELYVERDRARGTVGNVYKGKVLRVLPGMQAAFVDIGE